MKKLKSLKYLQGLIIPVLAWVSFSKDMHGWETFLPVIWLFVVIPLLELLFRPDPSNISKAEEKSRLDNILYDLQIYLMVPIQVFTLVYFLFSMQEAGLSVVDKIGRIASMGTCCGVLGINVGHELGHRNTWYEKLMAKINLGTSLNMHFLHEHNIHHHQMVGTPEDPATAKYGDSVFIFWFRSMIGVYFKAWEVERQRLKKKGIPFFSLRNEMIQDHIAEGAMIAAIWYFFGLPTVGYFVIAALIGHLLLETVNYIEHYGLKREKIGERYERVMPHHSWNSDHILGRLVLFELSRHSDHHYITSRKYQILRHMDTSPQMPTGYPGMMMLSTIPPLWFSIMNPKIREINEEKKRMNVQRQ
ncbi:alkane 1-monooxygenase [Flavobacterium sp. CS20]|uniref:alkane 1-monooxygenase n=1 Tax=Flavobacterium sp. CS20 TaxID=2775246 RepID=UPI001B3A4735|nr:alkane 1-monooxygenase [Flavobacterium sp. CS20]QTY27291.1 alkane 1-monooxygenase [Flavobacterium sp. CS20]